MMSLFNIIIDLFQCTFFKEGGIPEATDLFVKEAISKIKNNKCSNKTRATEIVTG